MFRGSNVSVHGIQIINGFTEAGGGGGSEAPSSPGNGVGGALVWICGGFTCDFVMSDCTFVNNTAPTNGGAVHLSTSGSSVVTFGTITVFNCTMQNNSITNDYGDGGGALAVDFTDSEFVSNMAVFVKDCLFVDNSASGTAAAAGAFSLEVTAGSNCSLSLDGSTFVSNVVTADGTTGQYLGAMGGAVNVFMIAAAYDIGTISNFSVSVTNSLFSDNQVVSTSSINAFGGG